jgi:dynein heavy chain 1
MVTKQQEAQGTKDEAETLSVQVAKSNEEINTQREIVVAELGEAEPALIEAKEAVSSVKKTQLDEVRGFANPPVLVKLTMEAVCVVLGEKGAEIPWEAVRKRIRTDGFLHDVVEFNTEKLTDKIRARIKKQYLSNADFNFEKVNKASRACGPLCKWLRAQVHYAEILDKVQPLREQVEALAAAGAAAVQQLAELEATISETEEQITQYKNEYAVLISETQAIKTDKEVVQSKVERSKELLKSLGEERTRWEEGSSSFQTQIATVTGDVFLSSGFMAYIGYFDEMARSLLLNQWRAQLDQVQIKYKSDLSLIEYLSKPSERLSWHANGLPSDQLCEENAIMLKRFNRYPLVIDPSGMATEFIQNKFKESKIAVTSFLDDSFMKSLESALRFGNPIIIQDVESYDPILNTILNKEIHKTGGRVLIRLADQDIDFSPSFQMFLITRDPTFNFTPDLNSRVTFVNFTITPSSLQSQCLNKVLKAEQPEVDLKRQDMLKLQGEFKVKLRELEAQLLDALNQAEGNLLDDDKVITTLETLKRDAAEVKQKAAETGTIMEQVEMVSSQYSPFAVACSRVYFAMESIADIHFFYQFSLTYFLEIFNSVVSNSNTNLDGVTEQTDRLEILTNDLFRSVFVRVSRGMCNRDMMAFALRLSQIKLKGDKATTLNEVEERAFLFGRNPTGDSSLPGEIFTKEQVAGVETLSALPSFSSLESRITADIAAWKTFAEHPKAEESFPAGFLDKSEDTNVAFQRLLVISMLRPDRFMPTAAAFVSAAMGPDFLSVPQLDLGDIVAKESHNASPLLLCSMPGFDASSKVDDLARVSGKSYKSIAMGSSDGYELAEKIVTSAAKAGSWVLLKNVHLACEWLMKLEKQLHRLSKHAGFRLFLTMEMSEKVPRNLVRISQTFVFEPPAGVKASLRRTLTSFNEVRMQAQPKERSRLYMLLAWFHAVVQERKRYCPIGWTKFYEFNDNDAKHALDAIDYWLESTAAGRANLAPDKIPWNALHTILTRTIYGGRVDNTFDSDALFGFMRQLFTADAYDPDFSLVVGEQLLLPDTTKYSECVQWVDKLPSVESPVWLGLPANAEVMLAIKQAKAVVKDLQRIQDVVDTSGDDDFAEAADAAEEEGRAPAWLRMLAVSIESWLKMLPEGLEAPSDEGGDALANPIARLVNRECVFGSTLLSTVRSNLLDINELCKGAKSSAATRGLAIDLSKGSVPEPWRKYPAADFTVSVWLPAFCKRLKQLQELVGNVDNVATSGVWLGGLFSPEAFVTATRQRTAQKFGWALEQLELQVSFGVNIEKDDGMSYKIVNLTVENADVSGGMLVSSNDLATNIPSTVFKWVQASEAKPAGQTMSFPVYLNNTRKNLLVTLTVSVTDPDMFKYGLQRGVALIASV